MIYALEVMRLRAHTMRVVQIKGTIPGITRSLNNISTAQIIPAFINKLNSPKVTILRGRVIRFIRGFKKKFKNPNMAPARINNRAGPTKLTSPINSLASQSPTTPAII